MNQTWCQQDFCCLCVQPFTRPPYFLTICNAWFLVAIATITSIAIITLNVKGNVISQIYDEKQEDMTLLEKLLEEKYGAVRGAQTKLAKELGTNQSTVASWVSGRNKPSIDWIKKLAALFNYSEDDIKTIFDSATLPASAKHTLLRDSGEYRPVTVVESKTDFPLRGFMKKGEVFFFEEADVPLPDNLNAPKRFSVEIRDDSAEEAFHKGEILDMLVVPVEEIRQYLGDQYLLVDIEGSQYIYACSLHGTTHCITVGKKRKELPKNAVILARVVAVKRFL